MIIKMLKKMLSPRMTQKVTIHMLNSPRKTIKVTIRMW